MNALPLASVLFAAALLGGCAAAERGAQPPPAPAVDVSAATPLDRWLAQACVPSAIVCAVEPKEAPDAVARFQALSERVDALYRVIYEDAHRVADGSMPVPEAPAGKDWRPTVQAAITAKYQAAMVDIEAIRKDLSAYTDTLADDATLTNSVQRTRLLTQFGQGASRLGARLDEAAEAARLMLRQGLSDVSAQ